MAHAERARFQLKNMVNKSAYRSRYSNSNTPRSRSPASRSRKSSISAHSHYTHAKNDYLSIPNIERTPCYGKQVETHSSNPMERGDLEPSVRKSERSSDCIHTVPQITVARGDDSECKSGSDCGSEIFPADDFDTPQTF